MGLRVSEKEFDEMMLRRGLSHDPCITPNTAPPPGPIPTKRSKYGNRRVEIDGKKFDSQHEAEVYFDLMMRVRAGELRAVLRQVPFDLPGNIRYFADFVTIDQDMRVKVYDAKSEATRKNRVYINKKKQMLDLWGIEIQEV